MFHLFWLSGSRQKRQRAGSLLSFLDDVHILSAFLLDVRVCGSRQKRRRAGSLLSFSDDMHTLSTFLLDVRALSFSGWVVVGKRDNMRALYSLFRVEYT